MEFTYFTQKLAALRAENDLSHNALGEMLGVSGHTVSRWEAGQVLPSLENVVKLSRMFKVSIDEMLSGEGQETTASSRTRGMTSLRELYKIGSGPSSSHTMGPEKAAAIIRDRYPEADAFRVTLFGSLAKTGRGHGTDTIIVKTLAPKPCEILFDYLKTDLPHPNTMEFTAMQNGAEIGFSRVFSIGGGAIKFEQDETLPPPLIYPLYTFEDIAAYCKKNRLRLWEYVEQTEGEGFMDYLQEIWNAMKDTIHSGLEDEGVLPGGLGVHKKARHLYNLQHIDESAATRESRLIAAYAFAVGEQNADGGRIVTAPTCGAAGVLPAVLYYQQKKNGFRDIDICRALATGGLIGNLIKANASISGAEGGCQAEIGSACAMAAAAMAELYELTFDKIEYAAEIAIEHHLGLTCDPICGLVQIPCIERNAVAAMRAINAVNLSAFLSDTRKISLDKVIIAMRETGRDIGRQYRETSEGGLAKIELC